MYCHVESVQLLLKYASQAVAREWFGNGVAPPVDGRLEFIQDTSMSMTHSLVELQAELVIGIFGIYKAGKKA